MSAALTLTQTLPEDQWEALAREAEQARARAYAPYSGYKVGAAILTTEGIVRGCNVENAAYPLGMCAEAGAVAQAVSQGAYDWLALAVATEGPEPGAPCGACRQILAEFALKLPNGLPIGLVVGGKVLEVVTLAGLLPHAFTSRVLRGQ
jgi:cytidine deaminase